MHNSPFDTSNIRKQSQAFGEFQKRMGVTAVLAFLIHGCSPSRVQWNNTINILLARDPNENLGLYWYLLCEMFLERTQFFRYALVLL